jgi:hypothetical protein
MKPVAGLAAGKNSQGVCDQDGWEESRCNIARVRLQNKTKLLVKYLILL